MTDLIRDKRGRAPTYVIVDDDKGGAVLLNQFTRRQEFIGLRPYSLDDVRAASRKLGRRDADWHENIARANAR